MDAALPSINTTIDSSSKPNDTIRGSGGGGGINLYSAVRDGVHLALPILASTWSLISTTTSHLWILTKGSSNCLFQIIAWPLVKFLSQLIAWPLVKVYNLLSLIMSPAIYMFQFLTVPLFWPVRLLELLEPLYIFFGVAVCLGIGAGALVYGMLTILGIAPHKLFAASNSSTEEDLDLYRTNNTAATATPQTGGGGGSRRSSFDTSLDDFAARNSKSTSLLDASDFYAWQEQVPPAESILLRLGTGGGGESGSASGSGGGLKQRRLPPGMLISSTIHEEEDDSL
ncbi:hypothetical protein B0H66DRAFT_548833 [Apodospora peruviana]|uniref:Uncharacterized protein n=1 Tax=Apodospora peruviana TaxID=516989 RepID=A0AAE0MAR3_9PEZI|nr:hypothetical protein B0H66DRAFT_548833 [Apodospora peruviana]